MVLEWAHVLGFLQVVLEWAQVWGALQVVLDQAQVLGFSAGGSTAGTGIELFGRWFWFNQDDPQSQAPHLTNGEQ